MSFEDPELDGPFEPETSPEVIALVESVDGPDAGPEFWSTLRQRFEEVNDESAGSMSNSDLGRLIQAEGPPADKPYPSGRLRHRALLGAAVLAVMALGAAFLIRFDRSSSSIDVTSSAPAEAVPSLLEAETMETRDSGAPEPGAWQIWRPGFVEEQVEFTRSGEYVFSIIAQGRSSGTAGPQMELRIDFVTVGSAVEVKRDVFVEYRFVVFVEKGTHDVAIANVVLSDSSEDFSPTLIVDRIEIEPSTS